MKCSKPNHLRIREALAYAETPVRVTSVSLLPLGVSYPFFIRAGAHLNAQKGFQPTIGILSGL